MSCGLNFSSQSKNFLGDLAISKLLMKGWFFSRCHFHMMIIDKASTDLQLNDNILKENVKVMFLCFTKK